jgi:hypothetical protein
MRALACLTVISVVPEIEFFKYHVPLLVEGMPPVVKFMSVPDVNIYKLYCSDNESAIVPDAPSMDTKGVVNTFTPRTVNAPDTFVEPDKFGTFRSFSIFTVSKKIVFPLLNQFDPVLFKNPEIVTGLRMVVVPAELTVVVPRKIVILPPANVVFPDTLSTRTYDVPPTDKSPRSVESPVTSSALPIFAVPLNCKSAAPMMLLPTDNTLLASILFALISASTSTFANTEPTSAVVPWFKNVDVTTRSLIVSGFGRVLVPEPPLLGGVFARFFEYCITL